MRDREREQKRERERKGPDERLSGALHPAEKQDESEAPRKGEKDGRMLRS